MAVVELRGCRGPVEEQLRDSGDSGDSDGERQETETLVADELLVEEVSIDGMCGVY